MPLYANMSACRTRVKICGITSVEDALAAVDAGADAIGLVFYPPSKRWVEPSVAAQICRALPPFVTTTGLVVDPETSNLKQIIEQVDLDLLQFHGDESDSFCQDFGKPYIKALRIKDNLDISALVSAYPAARGVLLDTWVSGVPGGTGQTFDWQLVPAEIARKAVLAGGLDSSNVADAVMRIRPYAVDVSGGVEQSPGNKCHRRMVEFIDAVRYADQQIKQQEQAVSVGE